MFYSLISWSLRVYPAALGGTVVRRFIYSHFWGHKSFSIPENVYISGIRNISIGHFFKICPFVKLFSEDNGRIIIGDYFLQTSIALLVLKKHSRNWR